MGREDSRHGSGDYGTSGSRHSGPLSQMAGKRPHNECDHDPVVTAQGEIDEPDRETPQQESHFEVYRARSSWARYLVCNLSDIAFHRPRVHTGCVCQTRVAFRGSAVPEFAVRRAVLCLQMVSHRRTRGSSGASKATPPKTSGMPGTRGSRQPATPTLRRKMPAIFRVPVIPISISYRSKIVLSVPRVAYVYYSILSQLIIRATCQRNGISILDEYWTYFGRTSSMGCRTFAVWL